MIAGAHVSAHNAASGPPHTPHSIGHTAFRPGVLINAPANADYSLLFLLLSNNDLPRPSSLCIPTNVAHRSSFNVSNEGESDVRPKPPNNEGIQSQVSFFSNSFFFLFQLDVHGNYQSLFRHDWLGFFLHSEQPHQRLMVVPACHH